MEQAPSRGHEASPKSGLGAGCRLSPSSKKLHGLGVRAQARRISMPLPFSVVGISPWPKLRMSHTFVYICLPLLSTECKLAGGCFIATADVPSIAVANRAALLLESTALCKAVLREKHVGGRRREVAGCGGTEQRQFAAAQW